jgi:hypothetical protein
VRLVRAERCLTVLWGTALLAWVGAGPARAETVAVTATAYGGYGTTSLGSNEGEPSTYRIRYGGTGVEATAFLLTDGLDSPRVPPNGLAVRLGAVGELRSQRLTACTAGSFCDAMAVSERAEAHGALRLGAGYELRSAGVRIGVLYADGIRPQIVLRPLIFPDLEVRIGQRNQHHGSIGLGAYDAATSLRPGLNMGFCLVFNTWQLESHLGLHAGLDQLTGSVLNANGRAAVDVWIPSALGRLDLGAAVEPSLVELHAGVSFSL